MVRLAVGAGGGTVVRAVVRGTVVLMVGRGTLGEGVGVAVEAGAAVVGVGSAGEAV